MCYVCCIIFLVFYTYYQYPDHSYSFWPTPAASQSDTNKK